MSRHATTQLLIAQARTVLAAHHPMTLRQLHYALVSRYARENTQTAYDALGRAMVAARKDGAVPWSWMEDRLRLPHVPRMWDSLETFREAVVTSWRRGVWATQPRYVEVVVEKDALSGVFAPIVAEYGVTLMVARGYESWSAVRDTAERLHRYASRSTTLLYFSDFDPAGQDMPRDVRNRLAELSCFPTVSKCALTQDDVLRYQLPHDFTKAKDSRAAKHIERYGDVAVELDALPLEVLQDRIRTAIEHVMDMAALQRTRDQQERERQQIQEALAAIKIPITPGVTP